ncbi:hypothetical protein JHK85_004648 [Glycine max]|nr:hypothetical protein JHK85_004648 [Glycine max]
MRRPIQRRHLKGRKGGIRVGRERECLVFVLTILPLSFKAQRRFEPVTRIADNLPYASILIRVISRTELHEAGNTFFYLPDSMILEWFEFQT